MSDEPRRGIGEVASAGLLGAATIASAWCAYQAALWSGEQTRSLARASAAHFDSLRATGEAHTFIMVDVSTFLSYVQDEARGEQRAAQYIREHARPEFRPALDHWIAERKAGREPRHLPFKSPLYRLEASAAAARRNEEASAAAMAANTANEHADLFVLHTVMFAMGLFFLGAASAARHRSIRRLMSVVGGLAVVLFTISMARLPRAASAPRVSDVVQR